MKNEDMTSNFKEFKEHVEGLICGALNSWNRGDPVETLAWLDEAQKEIGQSLFPEDANR